MKKIMILLFITAICILAGCRKNNEPSPAETEQATEKQVAEVEKSFEDWSKDDIQEVIMTGESSVEVSFSEEQIEEFVRILNAVEIDEEVPRQITAGHMFHYQVTKQDGSTMILGVRTPYITVDGVWYRTNYEPSVELNQFSHEAAGQVEKPFEVWSKDDIQEVIMTGESSIEISFSDEQIEEFVRILNAIVIYEEESPVDLDGCSYQYRITKEDRSVTVLENLNPYFVIDGAWHETTYEPCEELSQFSSEAAGLEW